MSNERRSKIRGKGMRGSSVRNAVQRRRQKRGQRRQHLWALMSMVERPDDTAAAAAAIATAAAMTVTVTATVVS